MSPTTRESHEAAPRMAWLVWTLALVCMGGFLFAKARGLEARAEADTHLASAEEYLNSHPYLDAPALLERHMTSAVVERLGRGDRERRAHRSAPPIPPRIRQREQDELDHRVAAASAVLAELPVQRWGLRAAEPRPLAFLTHLLAHGGWLQLLMNLALLLLLGTFLERSWGVLPFAAVVVLSAAGAALLFANRNPELEAPFVGIAGVLAGLTGAFGVRFGLGRHDVPFAGVMTLAVLVLCVPLGLGWDASIAAGDEVAAGHAAISPSAWALCGGFVSGALAAFGLQLIGAGAAGADAGSGERRASVSPQVARALEERAAGRLDEAFNLLASLVRRQPDDLAACRAWWDVANDLGRPASAAPAILRVIRDEIRRSAYGDAVVHWLELAAAGLDADAEAALLLRMATLLRESGERAAAARALRNALARGEEQGSTLAARVAREASGLDAQVAEDAAWRALGSLDLDLQERQSLEDLLEDLQPQLAYRPHEPEPDGEPARRPRSALSPDDLLSPEESEAAVGAALPDTRPDPIDVADENRSAEVLNALPTVFDDDGLCVDINGVKKRVRFDRIDAVAVAGIDGLGPRTVIVIDLVLNWMSLAAETLKVVRLRGDRFDPRRLMGGRQEPLDALRGMVDRLLRAADATPLPDLQSARGLPFAAYPDLATYQRDVLMVDATEDAPGRES